MLWPGVSPKHVTVIILCEISTHGHRDAGLEPYMTSHKLENLTICIAVITLNCASEVTTIWRYTNVYVIIIIN